MALLIFAVALFAGASHSPWAQCSSGGSGGGGFGGPTLATIAIDGDPTDWSAVLANPLQVTVDGEFTKNCNVAPIDRDCTPNTTITGRDLNRFAWTYDGTNIYLYCTRYGSSSNTQTFYFYMDTSQDQKMETGEHVLQVVLSGSNQWSYGTLYTYNQSVSGGDPLVAPSGANAGYADGYIMPGTLTGGVSVYGAYSGFADGTGFESYVPWGMLGVPAGTQVYYHVSSTNNSNPATVPAQIDDNLGGPNGQVGSFGFYLMTLTPNNSSTVAPGSPTVISYTHAVNNTGTLSDRYTVVAQSSQGFRVDLLDGSNTIIATDNQGDGVWDYLAPGYSDGGSPAKFLTPVVSNGTSYTLNVRLTAPTGVVNVADTTTFTATSVSCPSVTSSATDKTAIGNITLLPTPQSKSAVAGQTVDYGLRLSNYSVSDTFDLRAVSSSGYQVQIYTDPNGDGNPSDGALVATDVNGNGVYTDSGDSIAPGNDTNNNHLPDFGSISVNGYQDFVVRVTIPVGALVGAVDTTTVTVQGATYGAYASATLTTTVRNPITFTPSYTFAAGTGKYSGDGRSVFFAHTLINAANTALTVSLTSPNTSSHGWTVRYWTDPNGDGNPSDGALITGSFSLAANGGTLTMIVEVIIPSGIAAGTQDTTSVTASDGTHTASVSDQVQVSRLAVYADANHAISQSYFARCDTAYAQATSLVADTTTRYSIQWIYASTLVQNTTVPSDGNGQAVDSYTFPSGANPGTWTCQLKDNNSVIATQTFYLDPVGPTSTISPVTTGQASYATTGNNLSITATFNNNNTAASYKNTVFQYLVQGPNPSTSYLNGSTGIFGTYSSGSYTRTTSPHTVAAGASATETVTINSVQFNTAGLYTVTVSWATSCGSSIASATLVIPVGTTLGSYAASGGSGPKEYFGNGQSVYLYGTNYLQGTAYTVAYYDANGQLQQTQTGVTSTSGGVLNTNITTATLATSGTWHAVVYPSTFTPPSYYNSADPQALASDSFVVDLVAPTVTINQASSQADPTNTLPIHFTVVFSESVTGFTSAGVSLSGTAPGTKTITITGGGTTYDVAVGGLTGDGTVIASVIAGAALDQALNSSAASTSTDNTVTYDTTAPAAPVVSTPANGSSTTNTQPPITGTAEANSAVKVYVDGVLVATVTADSSGAWSYTPATPLAYGSHTVYATATDAAGNTSPASPTNTFNVIYPAPVVSGPIAAGASDISGTSAAPVGTTITVYSTVGGVPTALGTTTVQAGGTWTLGGVSGLVGGEQINATAGTGAATSAVSNSVIVTPDAPVVSSPIAAGASSISGTTSAPVGSQIQVYVNGVAYGSPVTTTGGSWTLSGVSGLVGGENITATVTAGGQASGVSNTVVVTPDSPTVNAVAEGATTVTGTTTAPAGSSVTVTIGGNTYTGTVVAGGGGTNTWSVTVPASATSAGATVSATVTANGQTSSAASVQVTPNPPAVTAPIYTTSTSITGTSSAPDGSTITIYKNGTSIGAATVTGGTWTLSGVSGLVVNDAITATVTAAGVTSSTSNTVNVSSSGSGTTPTPSVDSPLAAGATSVSGTSTSPAGTRIDVYVNGAYVGSTTVSGGTWTLNGIGPLTAGQQVTATATDTAHNLGTSPPSNPVTVSGASGVASIPPIVTASLLAGSPQTVYGSSIEAAGSIIDVYVNGAKIGSTTVAADGSWSLAGVTLTAGQLVTATVLAPGKTVSANGNVVTVAANSGSVTPAPVITSPVAALSTSVSGTAVAGATVDVYANGVYLGTTTANGSGAWTLSGLTALPSGTILSATATAAGSGTSDWSAPVVVGTMVMLLRSDAMTSLTQSRAPIFTHPVATPPYPSLETLGPNHVFNSSEGASPQPSASGTADDDKAYLYNVTTGSVDPDPTILTDNGRPLVFYELLDNNTKTLKLSKSGGNIVFTVTP